MDELNAHQFWGISPCVDLLAARSAAAAAAGPLVSANIPQEQQQQPVALLQLCPYDCRHLLATICGLAACKATATTTAAAAAPQPAAAQQHIQHQPQQPQQHQLQLYVYEEEPEVLARHMLLLAVLLDSQLTARERAEAFLELHGNAMLRQRTADYLIAQSKWLETSVAQLSVKAATGSQQQQDCAGDGSGSSSSSLGVLDVFDLSLLRYQERDALLEAFQKYRHKAGYDMARAWDGRLRKWYGERYDFRTNVIDWDYHMRLAPRGTPFLDPAAGSIVHFYHFRHWRLTGVAHELRGASYTAANTSLLSTAYGRTKEFKDRQLRDVGRSVSAFGYWGDQLNGPFHAFGTVADDPALFRLVNKQFSHTAVDVAEHNVLGFIASLCGRVGAAEPDGSADEAAGAAAGEGHRANAARGPTSLKALEAAAEKEQEPPLPLPQQQQQHPAADDLQQPNTPPQQASTGASQQQQQQQQDEDDTAAAAELTRLAAREAAAAAAAVSRLVGSVRIILSTGDLKRCLTGRQKLAGRFAAATVGHRHVHLIGPEHQLQCVVQPGGLVLVESGQNMVQLNSEQVAAFEARVVELAGTAGFERHPVLGSSQPAAAAGDSEQAAAGSGEESRQAWQLPPGHIALRRLPDVA